MESASQDRVLRMIKGHHIVQKPTEKKSTPLTLSEIGVSPITERTGLAFNELEPT